MDGPPMKRFAIIQLSLCLLSLNISVNAADFIDLASFPDWFKESVEREIEVKENSKLELETFKINSQVPGKLKLESVADNYWYYTIDIGTSLPVECYVFTSFDGAANSLHAIVDYGIEASANLNKKPLNAQYIMGLDVGLIKDTPYLLLDKLYILGDGTNNVSGVIKGLSARTDETLQICVHNELGYRDTFFNVFKSFTEAFIAVDGNSAFYESIYGFSVDGIPVGYAREKYTLDDEGDINEAIDTAMLLPVDSSNISRSDSVESSWSRPDGSLINGQVLNVENSTLASQFTIQYIEEKWVVEGLLQGKEITKTLEHDEWLMSNFGNYLAARELLASEDDKTDFMMWVSDTDPTSVMNIKLSKIADNPNANIKYDIGILAMDLNVDDNGTIRSGRWSQGPINMDITLMYAKGEPVVKK